MKPDPKKKPRLRPRARNRNGKARKKSIQIKLSDEEYDFVRRMFGRAAAAMARDYWLGFQAKNPTAPNAESVLPMVRALYACQADIECLVRQFQANQSGQLIDTLQHLKNNFQNLICVWYSIFSAKKQ